ncbi:MAG: hypothetical protein H0U85_07160 [Gemmatimonadales bacterium]|nr:hypothetical protein [Gemmatimonadales bacterium]
MTLHDPFDSRPDAALGRLLREHLDAGDDAAFVARVRAAVRKTGRDTSWDVLTRWARPGLAAASVIIGIGLWLALNRAPDTPSLAEAISPADAPAQMLAGTQSGSDVVLAALMGGQ